LHQNEKLEQLLLRHSYFVRRVRLGCGDEKLRVLSWFGRLRTKPMKHAFGGLLVLVAVAALGSNAAAERLGARALEAQSGASEASKDGKAKKKRLSDAQVRQILIDESIAAYSGNCPCPYSRARNGSRCGRRSAYDREGGEAPLCFAKDVTAEMVQAYRDANPES
jgi:hypothetical protein